MNKNRLLKIESLTQLHSAFGLDKPVHPLVSLVKLEDVKISPWYASRVPGIELLQCFEQA